MRLRTTLCLALLTGCVEYQLDNAGEFPDDVSADPADPDQTTEDPTEPDVTDPTEPLDTGDVDTDNPGFPEAGCSDGDREGFQSWDDYPDIAACSGGWTVGGVTRNNLVPTCGRVSGDDSANTEGDGCSAADLCMDGWHVCDGAVEVAANSFDGCQGAVPPGTPDKALFFAVSQHSDDGSVCDDSSPNGNDVYGCGNLGTQLDAGKNCGVLDRVLASMNPDSCGFNEAEPNLGPWECVGGQNSHLAEGTLVTKMGCPWDSCQYDGFPVGNQDKGGVVCCRD